MVSGCCTTTPAPRHEANRCVGMKSRGVYETPGRGGGALQARRIVIGRRASGARAGWRWRVVAGADKLSGRCPSEAEAVQHHDGIEKSAGAGAAEFRRPGARPRWPQPD